MTWYPANRDGLDDPYLEEFAITGWLPDGFDAETACRELASSPTYRLFQGEDGVGSGGLWAAVHLAIHAYLPPGSGRVSGVALGPA